MSSNQRQHPLLQANPELKRELLRDTSYPDNHSSNDAAIAAATREILPAPGNWFRRPAVNPLAGRKFFPSFDQLPDENDLDEDYFSDSGSYRKFWILLAEISDASMAGVKFLRNEVHARDKAGRVFPVYFYPEDYSTKFNYKSLCLGSTMVFFCPTAHTFLDGRVGLRIELLEMLRMLPMPLAAVLRSAEVLHACSVHKCWQCKLANQRPLMRCTACGYARYCGKKCQTDDWARHRVECAQGCVRQIARLVYFAYGSGMRQVDRENIGRAHPFDLFSGGKR